MVLFPKGQELQKSLLESVPTKDKDLELTKCCKIKNVGWLKRENQIDDVTHSPMKTKILLFEGPRGSQRGYSSFSLLPWKSVFPIFVSSTKKVINTKNKIAIIILRELMHRNQIYGNRRTM